MRNIGKASVALLSVAAAILAAALATVLIAGRPSAEAPEEDVPALVRVEMARRDTLRRTISLSGAVDSAHAVAVASKASGTLVELYVDVGDTVVRGSRLGLVDDEPYRIALDQARAAEAAASTELDRARRLYEGGSAGRQALDAAKAKADAASSQRELAEVNYGNCKIASPVDGVVVHRASSPGSLVAAGAPVVTLDASGEPLVAIQVPERYAAAFMAAAKPAVTLSVRAAGLIDADAELRTASPMVKPDTRTFEVLCAFKRPPELAMPGLSARATFTLEERVGVPTLPASALADGSAVWIVDDGGFARRLELPGGAPFTDGERFELPESFVGMEFIVEGSGFLADGDRVASAASPSGGAGE